MVSVLWNEEARLSFEGCGEDGGEEAGPCGVISRTLVLLQGGGHCGV